MNRADIWGEFFRGAVRFAGQGLLNAKYSLVANGTIIRVKNSVHIRLIENQFALFPDQFDIIAPIDAVTILSGSIPQDDLHYLPASEYLRLRMRYLGH